MDTAIDNRKRPLTTFFVDALQAGSISVVHMLIVTDFESFPKSFSAKHE
jgi:hypothetical protein